jgi:hypothetical protein
MSNFLEQAYLLLVGMIEPILLVTGAIVWLGAAVLFAKGFYDLAKAVVITLDAVNWIVKMSHTHNNPISKRSLAKYSWALFKEIASAVDRDLTIKTKCGQWLGYRNWVIYPPEQN